MSFPPPAALVEKPEYYDGLDLLGLRNPVQRIGNDCLNGIVTVTPAVRYLSIYCWLLRCYWQQGRPAKQSAFRRFSADAEFALVLANRLVDPRIGNLIGADKARGLLAEGGTEFVPTKLANTGMPGVYSAVAGQLGLAADAPVGGVAALTRERGAALAELAGAHLEATGLGRRIAEHGVGESVARDELVEFGQAARLDVLAEDERRLLAEIVLPSEPRSKAEERRLASYGLLLHLADRRGKPPSQSGFFNAVASDDVFPDALTRTRTEWGVYLTRDSIAVLHEALLSVTVNVTRARGGTAKAAEVIEAIVGSTRQEEALRGLELTAGSDGIGSMGCAALMAAVVGATKPTRTEFGRVVWPGSLQEPKLIAGARGASEGVGLLTLVGWMLAVRRNEPALAAEPSRGVQAAGAGAGRLGLREVIAPHVDRWVRDDVPVVAAIAELVQRTVDQHLRIVWSRRNNDPHRDAGKLAVDGSSWRFRGSFGGGRSLNPLPQAVGWLRSLGLVSADGLTDEGEAVYQRIIATGVNA